MDGSGHGHTSTVIYDPGSGKTRPGPEMSTPRFKHAVAMLDDGRILVLGGTTDDTELLASTEVLNLAANFGNELFLTHPDTKVIQTALLLVLSVVVVWRDRELFLTPPSRRT